MSYNKVILQGNIGRIDDARYTAGGEPVINFSLATDEPFRDGNEWKVRAAWHRIVAFGESFQRRLEHAKQGSSVIVEGYLRYREWTPDDGVKRVVAEVVLEVFKFVGGKRPGQDSGTSESDAGNGVSQGDDTPFDEPAAAEAPAATPAARKSSRGGKSKGSGAAT